MRVVVVSAVLSLGMLGLAAAGDVQATIRRPTHIEPQPLRLALKQLAEERGFQVLYVATVVGEARTVGVDGNLTATEALRGLLAGTGLSFKYVDDKTVTVFSAAAGSATAPWPQGSLQQSQDRSSVSDTKASGSFWDRFRLAQEDQGTPASASSLDNRPGQGLDQTSVKLDEVIVTAQKRKERLQDVPVPVTAINADTLAENSQTRLQDFFATVPGLSLNTAPFGGGQQIIVLRGLSTGPNTNPTVAVTIDGVPYGSSTTRGLGSILSPDIDPGDLARIEVLRGPQGTLYGASSLGGLINYVTQDPSTAGVSGHIQLLGDRVEHGNAGYAFRGSINVPLSDAIALRISGFTRRDPGYVNNVTTGQRDVNQVDTSGGRFSLLWHLSDTISLKLNALLQNSDGSGSPIVDTNSLLHPVFGDLTQARMPGTEGYSAEARLYTATLNARIMGLDFISITGYSDNKYSQPEDVSRLLGSTAESLFGVSGASLPNYFETKKLTQEFRLMSQSGGRVEWLAGAYYTHEDTPASQAYIANDPTTGAPVGVMANYNDMPPQTLAEYSAFGDLTFHFNDRFDVQLGGRQSKIKQTFNETDTGPVISLYGEPNPYVQPTERVEDDAFTYLLTPRFKVSPDLMIYARFASGYRVGGTNIDAALTQVPVSYGPDKTHNYELGVKGEVFDHSLVFDASAYYIDWKDIQVHVLDPVTLASYTGNAGEAKSQGLEFSLQARPITGLTVAAVASLSDAKLKQALPPTPSAVAAAGDRLPYSSRFTGTLSAEWVFSLTDQWQGLLGGSLNYVGEREGQFAKNSSQVRLQFPPYAELNLRLGARLSTWDINLFANNVTDRRGIVGGNVTFVSTGYGAGYIQPRTTGLSVSKSF